MTTDPLGQPRHARVRLGIVGLGAVAQAVHLPILERLRDAFAITALCDLSPTLLGAIGQRYGVPPERRFTNASDLLEADVDAVVVLASGSHGELTLQAIDRGLPVFVEKPLAWTLHETDAILARGAAADRVEVGYMKLWDPAVRRAGDLVERARTERGSEIRAIEVTVLHPTSERQLWQARLLDPPTDLAPTAIAAAEATAERLRTEALGDAAATVGPLYTNILLGSVIHDLAVVRAFAGDPVEIDYADAWPAGAWPPSVAVAGRFAGGARLTLNWHYLPAYGAYRELVRVVLDDATVELEFPSPYYVNAPTRLQIVDPDGDARRDTTWLSPREAFEEELLAFHELVTAGTAPFAGVREGRADVVTCLRIATRIAEAAGLAVGGEAATIGAREAVAAS